MILIACLNYTVGSLYLGDGSMTERSQRRGFRVLKINLLLETVQKMFRGLCALVEGRRRCTLQYDKNNKLEPENKRQNYLLYINFNI